ncbi:TonB-dependent receptor [Sphingomonas sp. ASV193]|uniref:TonB-dependent receptor n=1 Tax=Sphingomonas sp. ASV193 TaxID=3144405 RepID=UPI0032E90123
MPLFLAALLLNAAAPPPADDDDDQLRHPERSLTAQQPASNADTAATRRAQPSADADQDEKATPAKAVERDDDEGGGQSAGPIVVTARRLDAARTQIDAELGASVYSLTNDTVENRPGGETGSVADILSQAPGVTLSGQSLYVRGSPANQVRINNVIVPGVISDPADQLSSRLAQTTRLMTGTLPAQYGFAPAGVISITTKNGLYQHGGQAELFAGTDGMVEPAVEWAGSFGKTSLFASGSLERERARVGDVFGNVAGDRRTGFEGLGFADRVIDDENRVSVVYGGSRQRHRIGTTAIASGVETNSDEYGVATYQHSRQGFTLQASGFVGFVGFARDVARFDRDSHENRVTWGSQIDGTDAINEDHTLRFGLLAARSSVRELDLEGDLSRNARTSLALYVQDEWELSPALTINPGVRAEWLRGVASKARIEPRASVIWKPSGTATLHVGYARYATSSPLGETAATGVLPDETDDYFDAGFQQKVGALTLGFDGYWRKAHHYIDERQRIGSATPVAFEFEHARIRGVELSATYARRRTTAWGNISISKAEGSGLIGGSLLLSASEIASAAHDYLPLASDRPFTASGGLTQKFGRLSLSGDVLLSSGTMESPATERPNRSRHSTYAVVGVAAVYHARFLDRPTDIRVDITNLTNVRYATNDATALEGGWTRWGRQRAVTIGIEQGF